MDGYIYPNKSVTFIAKFQPTSIKCMIKTKAKCIIEKFKTPLELMLSGNCVNLPAPTETLRFKCPVRMMDLQPITITNK